MSLNSEFHAIYQNSENIAPALPSNRRTQRVYAPNDAEIGRIANMVTPYEAIPLTARTSVQSAEAPEPEISVLPENIKLMLREFDFLHTRTSEIDEIYDINDIGTDDKILNICAETFNKESLDELLKAAELNLFSAKSVYLWNLSEVLPEHYEDANDFDFDALVSTLCKILFELAPDEVLVREETKPSSIKTTAAELLIHNMCLRIAHEVKPSYFTIEAPVLNTHIEEFMTQVKAQKRCIHVYFWVKERENQPIQDADVAFFKDLEAKNQPDLLSGLIMDWTGKYKF